MKRQYIQRLAQTILRGRLEPVETILAVAAFVHGLWLTFPGWGLAASSSPTAAPKYIELAFGLLFMVFAVIHLSCMHLNWERARKQSAFLIFISWLFIFALALLTVSLTSVIWIAYLTIMLLSAVVYLNISMREI